MYNVHFLKVSIRVLCRECFHLLLAMICLKPVSVRPVCIPVKEMGCEGGGGKYRYLPPPRPCRAEGGGLVYFKFLKILKLLAI